MNRNDYIKKYLEWGWTVLPIEPGLKRPMVNWKDYQDRRPTRQELNDWFADHPERGVGLVTGKASGVIAIDEDSYKDKGITLDLDTPLISQTGAGGKHYFLKYTEGISNSVNAEKAIDVRGEGGFLVLPPTIHPNKNSYRWLKGLPQNLNNLPTLDESLSQEIIRSHRSSTPLVLTDYMDVSEGGRNDSLHRMACSLLNKVSEEEAFLMVQAVNKGYQPPLSETEVRQVFESARSFIQNNPKQAREQTNSHILEIISFNEAEKKHQELMSKYGNGLSTGYAVLDTYFKFIPTQLYMLSSATHLGKTSLALNIAGRMARQGRKILFASLEQGVFIIPRLISMFGSKEGMENLSIVAPTEMPTVEDFIETFQDPTIRPELLIIDHLHYFKRKGKGATEEMDILVTKVQMLANKLEIPILAVAHLRKLNNTERKEDKIPTMDDLKDTASLSQIPGVVMLLHRKKNEDEAIQGGAGIYSNDGTLFINKNRVFGKTGNEAFTMLDNGEIIFKNDLEDKINPKAEEIPGLEGFFDE